LDIQTAVKLCRDDVYANRSENTARVYEKAFDIFLSFLEDFGIEASSSLPLLTMEEFIRFPGWLSRKYTNVTAKTYVYGIKYFLEFLVIDGHLEPDYRDSLRYDLAVKNVTRKREDKLPRFPDIEDAKKMLEAVRQLPYDSPITERNIAIFEFFMSIGCRVSEVCKLEIKDLDSKIESGIVDGKGSKERWVFITRTAREALLHYWKVRGFRDRSDPAFARHDRGAGDKKKAITPRSVVNVCHEASMIAGIEQFTPHYFRHWFAIKFIRDNGNVVILKDLLGHESLDSTQVYAKAYDRDKEDAHRGVFD